MIWVQPIIRLLQTPDEELSHRDGKLKRVIETILLNHIHEMKRILAEFDAPP